MYDNREMAEPITTNPEVTLDPDFTANEHKEFEKLENEQPYREIKEETIRIPQRPEKINDTRNDVRFLVIFCIIITIILGIIIVLSLTGNGPK